MTAKNQEEEEDRDHHSLINIHGLGVPDDVCYSIINLLSVGDICSLASCCRQWRLLCSSNFIWHSLYRRRWQSLYQRRCGLIKHEESGGHGLIKHEGLSEHRLLENQMLGLSETAAHFQGWNIEYKLLHKQMSMGAVSVIEYIKAKACSDSLEVAEYQRAMALLASTGLELQDVEMFMFMPKVSVLVNLLGLHYCLTNLKTKCKDVREALVRSNVGERQVCLRWWSLGGWTNGYRRHDEMHMRIASLVSVIEMEPPSFLDVIDRGTLHEVLRVQISADFESSAWVARSMHSQR